MALNQVLEDHDKHITSLVESFNEELSKLLAKAQANVQGRLMDKLDFTDGKLDQSAANRKLLRSIDDMMLEELDTLGLGELTDAFVSQFGGQFQFFKDVLNETLGKEQTAKLGLDKLTTDDKSFLSITQMDAADNIEGVLYRMADNMRRKALAGIGGLTTGGLASLISEEVSKTPALAKTEAATATSSFYRTLADLSFRKIEEDQNWTIRYRYVGPPAKDPLIRQFCEHLMERSSRGSSWTREQIDMMDNEQLDNVFVTGGGYNCRHQWIVDGMRPKGKTDTTNGPLV
jgi:hypothetical protein